MSGGELEARLRANLDDWDCWRVYADWLTDQGDERGELVGLAYRSEQGSLSPHEQERYTQLRRTFKTWGAWRHGFLVEARPAPLPEAVQKLLAQPDAALVATLDLRARSLGDDDLAALVRLPETSRLTGLRLQINHLTSRGLAALASSPHVDNLVMLDLRYNPIDVEGARALSASPHLTRLRYLYVHRDQIGYEGARALSRSEFLPLSLRRFWRGW